MNAPPPNLITPIFLKLTADMPWPQDKAFYVIARNGLFRCRNHPFFRSSVPVTDFPAELAEHEPFIQLSYPKVPQRLFEKVIGFFTSIGMRCGAEAAVLLVWNKTAEAVEVVVPPQTSYVGQTLRGEPYPIEVHYEVPLLPPQLTVIGDIHSHVDLPAYASGMDQQDEIHRPGLHIVVGRIDREPPEFHVEATVDGMRFKVSDLSDVVQGYERRRTHETPRAWLERVKIRLKVWTSDRDASSPKGRESICSSARYDREHDFADRDKAPAAADPDPKINGMAIDSTPLPDSLKPGPDSASRHEEEKP